MTTTELFEVGPHVLKSVLSSLNYSSVNLFNEDAKKIQEWMKEQPHLPEIMYHKKIQNFLILNEGSVEKTKIKINNYYTMRSEVSDIFVKINPKLPYTQKVLDGFYLVPLPKLTKEMYRVFFYRTCNKVVLDKLDPIDNFRYGINLQEIRLMEDVTYGDVCLIDGRDVSFTFISKITPVVLNKTLILIYKKVFSNRLKGVYIFNAPSFIDKFLAVLKLVLKPKILNRIHIYQNSDFMFQRFGKEMIPRDYGGEEKSLQELQDMVRGKFHQYEKHFDRLDELRVDETLRPEKLTNDDILGCYGNFKKLDID